MSDTTQEFIRETWRQTLLTLAKSDKFREAVARTVSAEAINAMVEADEIKSKKIAQLRKFAEIDVKTIVNLTALLQKKNTRIADLERALGERHDEIRNLHDQIRKLKDGQRESSAGSEILDEIGALNASEQYIRLFGCYWRTTAAWTRDSIPHKIELEMVGPPRVASMISAARKEQKQLSKAFSTPHEIVVDFADTDGKEFAVGQIVTAKIPSPIPGEPPMWFKGKVTKVTADRLGGEIEARVVDLTEQEGGVR